MTPVRKRVPLRTCVLCGEKAPKRALTRIVATPEGAVKIDASGRLPGRGTYMCGDPEHCATPPRRGRVEAALRRRMTDEDWRRLEKAIADRGA